MFPYECRHGNHESDCPTCNAERLGDRIEELVAENSALEYETSRQRDRAKAAESRVQDLELAIRNLRMQLAFDGDHAMVARCDEALASPMRSTDK